MPLVPQESLRRTIGSTSANTPSPRISNPVQVSWYGAVGDGTADDTAAILAAMTAAGPGGVTFFTPGKTYKTTSQINIPSDYLTISGYGAIITSATAAQWGKFSLNSRTGVKILGLRFNCLYSTVASQGYATIDIGTSTETLVRDCEINDTPMGVRISGACVRTTIEKCRFYKNFLAINSDDDTVSGPTYNRIVGNTIRTGLDTVGTAGSGAIKMDDSTATANSYAGHVVALNQITTAGQVGIELFDNVNGCAIATNTIYGCQWGITCAQVSVLSLTGNIVRACTLFGIEMVAATECSLNGNVVDGKNTSGTNVGEIGIILNNCSRCSVSGGAVRNITNTSLWAVDSDAVGFTGVQVFSPYIGIEIKNTTDYIVSNCGLIATTGALHFIRIDCNDASCERGLISTNVFQGSVSQQGVRFYTPTALIGIQDLVISNNNIGGALSTTSDLLDNPSGAGFVRRVSAFDNPCSGVPVFSNAFEFATTSLTADNSPNYRFKTILCDATAGAFTVTLPTPVGIAGEIKRLVKTDASINAITVATAAGSILGTIALSAQYRRATVQSTGANWIVLEAN